MAYRSLRACVSDLASHGQLLRIDQPVDPYLEAAEIQRRVYAAGGPAIYFAHVTGCRFPMVSNLFGTLDRARFLFRDTLAAVKKLVELKIEPPRFLRRPWHYLGAARAAWHMRPTFRRQGSVLANETSLDQLPRLVCWPNDGGPFVTLPQVYTEDPRQPGWRQSNLGMYRIQLAGNQYQPNQEVGLHYQIHRGIGVHHAHAIERGEPLRVCVFVGGPPAMALSAVMPLPEGLPELAFAGALGGRRVPLVRQPQGPAVHAEADFCLTGYVDPGRLLPEGPFGDHLGYYARVHDFPVMRVEHVWHRDDAIWPFTVVGRPPQEDTTFGELIHELTGPAIPSVIHGVRGVHAVDAAGVHPLLLAVGSERYVPYEERRRPRELLTQANAILGQGQLSLAKYLFIVAHEDDPGLDLHDVAAFLRHVLLRVDWRRDLHFQTCTTIDTLDYSGTALNEGSKLVVACAGPPRRELGTEVPRDASFGPEFTEPRSALPGVLVLRGPAWRGAAGQEDRRVEELGGTIPEQDWMRSFPLWVVVDDSHAASRSLRDFLWTCFTRSNPAADVHGVHAFTEQKHWGCRGPLLIDARSKPHHAPPLVEDAEITRRVDALAAPGGPLHGIL